MPPNGVITFGGLVNPYSALVKRPKDMKYDFFSPVGLGVLWVFVGTFLNNQPKNRRQFIIGVCFL